MQRATADRIADVARTIVDEDGSAAVTMRRIAEAIGVTPMTIYRHYADRDALLQRVANLAFDEIAQGWVQEHAEEVDVDNIETLVREIFDELLDLALGRPNLYAFLFTEERARARRFPQDFEARQSPTLNILAEVLLEGMRIGHFRNDDVWELSTTLSATLHGLVQLRRGGRIGLPDDAFRTLCIRAVERILNGIRV